MSRLLACYDCNKLIKLPDFDGKVGMYDAYLAEACQRHQHNEIPDAQKKGGQLFSHAEGIDDLIDVEKQITNAFNERGKWFTETRDEFLEDAMECWKKHKSPGVDEGCADFRTDAKLIGKKYGVRAEARRYICSFCPLSALWATDDQLHVGARRGNRGTAMPLVLRGPKGMELS